MIVRKNSLTPIDFNGLAIYDFTAGNQGSSSFAVIEVPAGARHPLAKSTKSDKYYYVVRGKVCFHLEGVEYDLSEGDLCLVKKEQAFSYRNDTGETARLVLVHTPAFDMEAEVFLGANDPR